MTGRNGNMGNWKLMVENYGKIESAEIEMAPLTLFVGDNNSGKSYLLSLLWGIENLGSQVILGNNFIETEQAQSLGKWIWKQIDIAIEKKKNIVGIGNISDMLEKLLNIQLEKNKNELAKKIFNSENVEIGKLTIKFINTKKLNICFEMHEDKSMYIYVNKHGNRMFIDDIKQKYIQYRETKALEILILWLYSSIMDIAMDEMNGEGTIYLPAARTGFMLTKDIINKVGRKNTFNISSEKEIITPFVRPINQFLDIMGDLSIENTGSGKAIRLVESLEREIVDGTVELSNMPNKEIQYVPSGYEKGIPLRLASAVVSELSPFILILKHKANIKKFCYEEPEMCLHPQLQYKMGKIIGRTVNSGIGMVITTHSDIILQHINNMIKLSKHENREEICKNFGYTEQDLLACENVKIYQLEAKNGKRTEVKELLCGENGFAVPTFNNALNIIMDESCEIQG